MKAVIPELGKQIKAFRKERKLTLEELALMIDCSESHLSLVENGLRDPSIYMLSWIAWALGVNLDINLTKR